MFFYLSFLRPPPVQAPLHGSISITPQLSNDLRTESFEDTQDLYYTWAFVNDKSASNDAHRTIATRPTKLTTWRPSTAYKEIPVSIPQNVREGQKWRLILTCQEHVLIHPMYIDLRKDDVGSKPFSVMSRPILFSSKASGAGKSKKQDMIERIYLLPFSIQGSQFKLQEESDEKRLQCNEKSDLAYLKFTEKTSYDLDKKIWDSGLGLSSWICEIKEKLSSKIEHKELVQLRSVLFSDQRCKILELGAGIGLVSVAMAILRSDLRSGVTSDDRDVILATDVSTAMPLLEQNILENAQYYSTSPHALVLDWDDERFPPKVKDLGGFDIIVMADVSYNTVSFPALSRVLSNLIRLGSKPPLVLLGYKERDEAERTFWIMASQIGIHFDKVGERKGAGGAPVEIWLGNVAL